MKENNKEDSAEMFTFARDSYLDRTSRPVYALTYLIGFILLYEIGTILISQEVLVESLAGKEIRVVSFEWIKSLLSDYLNFPARLAWITTPLMVVVILLALQITSRKPWKVRALDFVPMTIESNILAVPLIVLCMLINRTTVDQIAVLSNAATNHGLAVSLVTGIGAGIYEELVFRLILISFLMLVFQDFIGMTRKSSIILSVVISAFLFSLHHHVFFIDGGITTGEPFVWSVFIFRMAAGVYFAAIFAVRGFGIAVGTHAFYDILVAVLNFWAE